MKILLIKLGALGDVLRTTPLLTGIKSKYPKASITWLVDDRHRSVLENNPMIDSLQSLGIDHDGAWAKETYDWVINLDKEPEALDAFCAAHGKKKMGFGRDVHGKLCAANPESEYAYRLGMDDELKFRLNKKTYQEICFEQAGLRFGMEEYMLFISDQDKARSQAVLANFKLSQSSRVVGINTGSGQRFAGKRMPDGMYRRLTELLTERLRVRVMLLGGQDEVDRNRWIEREAKVAVMNPGSHSIGVFAGLVSACDLVITGDTTALHIAVATKVPVVAYFGSTCASEIELYGRGEKIVSTLDCAPCYKKECPIQEKCMSQMSLDDIVASAERMLSRHAIRIS